MDILITGDSQRQEGFKKIIIRGEHTLFRKTPEDISAGEKLDKYNIIIDLNLDEYPRHLENYASLAETIVIGCAVKKSLARMVHGLKTTLKCTLGGINALPYFIERSLAEVSYLNEKDKTRLEQAFSSLGIKTAWVSDRTGMAAPRILFMIFNEAYYTVQEGTASPADIDKSMRLGVNYPMGPFEWVPVTGLKNIYETLEAIYEDTHDEGYRICPQLKREYLLLEQDS